MARQRDRCALGSRLVPFTGAYVWRGESRPQRRSRRSRPPLLSVPSSLLPPPLSLGTRKDPYQKQLITRRGCAPLTRLSRIPCPLEARRTYARVANAIPYKWIPP